MLELRSSSHVSGDDFMADLRLGRKGLKFEGWAGWRGQKKKGHLKTKLNLTFAPRRAACVWTCT